VVSGYANVGWDGGGTGSRSVDLVIVGAVGVCRADVVVGLPDGAIVLALVGVVVLPIDVVVVGTVDVVAGTVCVVVGMLVVVVDAFGEGLVERVVVPDGATVTGAVVVVIGSWLGLTSG
jgi:hypothetical protein